MISLSRLCKRVICLCVISLVGYLHLFDFMHMSSAFSRIRLLVALVGIALASIVIQKTRTNSECRKLFSLPNKYMVWYGMVMIISSIHTVFEYQYSMWQLLTALTPYLYVFFAYPLIYIFYVDKTEEYYINKISQLCVGILLIKAVSWFLYTRFGLVLFHDLLFQFNSWSRDGLLRVEAGYLFGLIFAYYAARMCRNKKISDKVITLFLILFMIFITRFRFQLLSMIFTLGVVYYYTGDTRNKKNNRLFLFLLIALTFVAFGGLDIVLSSFSVNSQHGASTMDRLLTIEHYWELMKNRKAILGLGLLDINNNNAYSIMYRLYYNRDTLYFLEDIGILGGFFKFGILSLPLYGVVFWHGIKVARKCIRKCNRNIAFYTGAVGYMIASCLALNIFDGQRAFNFPFYIAIIGYYSYIVEKN